LGDPGASNAAAAASAAAAAAAADAAAALAAANAAQATADSALSLATTLSGTIDQSYSLRAIIATALPTVTPAFTSQYAVTAFGTQAFNNIANTSYLTGRLSLSSASTSGTNRRAGWTQRSGTGMVWRGDAAGQGGFRMMAVFARSGTLANQRAFIGLSAAADPADNNATDADPANWLNSVGLGIGAGETNYYMYTNDGSGTATRTSLASITVSTTEWYTVELFAAPNASIISYRITMQSTGTQVSGDLSSDLPASTAFLGFRMTSFTSSTSGQTNIFGTHWLISRYSE